ncbi:hemopexin domain-containing protein [Anaeramoeba flamelloides]|uniref:Hemopexin domain-containing protein n=1 Tax=Anaeramoeba flamelloides TaxID=1746091 RepID=A0ABQ8Y671_9EUKA|nr:hemopexin domain-containing protein [Anaeramoeba flamelloides]
MTDQTITVQIDDQLLLVQYPLIKEMSVSQLIDYLSDMSETKIEAIKLEGNDSNLHATAKVANEVSLGSILICFSVQKETENENNSIEQEMDKKLFELGILGTDLQQDSTLSVKEEKNESDNTKTNTNELLNPNLESLTHSKTFEEELEMELLKNELIDFSDDEMEINVQNENRTNEQNANNTLESFFESHFADLDEDENVNENQNNNEEDEDDELNKTLTYGIQQFSSPKQVRKNQNVQNTKSNKEKNKEMGISENFFKDLKETSKIEFEVYVMDNEKEFKKQWKIILSDKYLEIINSLEEKIQYPIDKFRFLRNHKQKNIAKIVLGGKNIVVKFENIDKCNQFSELRSKTLINISGGTLKPKKNVTLKSQEKTKTSTKTKAKTSTSTSKSKSTSTSTSKPKSKSKPKSSTASKKEKKKTVTQEKKPVFRRFLIEILDKKKRVLCKTHVTVGNGLIEFVDNDDQEIKAEVLNIKFFHLKKIPVLEIEKKKYSVQFKNEHEITHFISLLEKNKKAVKLGTIKPNKNMSLRGNNEQENEEKKDQEEGKGTNAEFKVDILTKDNKVIGKGTIVIEDNKLEFIEPTGEKISDKIVYVIFGRSKKLKRVGKLNFTLNKRSFFIKFEKTKVLKQFEKVYSLGFQQTLKTHKFKIKVIKNKADQIMDKGNIYIRGNEIKICLKETTIVGKIGQVKHFKHKSNPIISRLMITEYSLNIQFANNEKREKFSKILTLSNQFVIPQVALPKEFQVRFLNKNHKKIANGIIHIENKTVSIRINGEETLNGIQNQVFLTIEKRPQDDEKLSNKKKQSKKNKKKGNGKETGTEKDSFNPNITMLFNETKGKAFFKLKNAEDLKLLKKEFKIIQPDRDPNVFRAIIIQSQMKKLKKDVTIEITFKPDSVQIETVAEKKTVNFFVSYNKFFDCLRNEERARVNKFLIGKKKFFILEFASKSDAKAFSKRVGQVTQKFNQPKKGKKKKDKKKKKGKK